MGDPKKLRKKYATPVHPWNKVNIDEEKILVREYGLGNKREIYVADSFLKKYKNIAKRLTADTTAQARIEEKQILGKLQQLGLLPTGAILDEVLSLNIKNILERRLQSIVFRKGLARSIKQARQFITHRHIHVLGREVTFPSYLVTLEEESAVEFKAKSALSNEDHPERVNEAKEIHEEKEATLNQDKKTDAKAEPVEVKEEEKTEKKTEEVPEKKEESEKSEDKK